MILIDLSSNFITKFYEYLLSLATFIDLSSNKIQSLPSSAIKALNSDQLKIKTLKLDNNPLEYPQLRGMMFRESQEICLDFKLAF